jgi:SulP family sulfate permease
MGFFRRGGVAEVFDAPLFETGRVLHTAIVFQTPANLSPLRNARQARSHRCAEFESAEFESGFPLECAGAFHALKFRTSGFPKNRSLTLRAFNSDVAGGFSAALVALPQSMSLGILAFAALGPAYASAGMAAGLVASVVGNAVSAVTSDVKCQIVAARASATAVIAGLVGALAVHPELVSSGTADVPRILALVALTLMMAGLLQVAFGLAGLGRAIKFVPYPVVAGFMNGIALIILAAQLRPILGLPGLAPVGQTLGELDQAKTGAIAVALFTVLMAYVAQREVRRVPALFCGLAAGICLHHLLRLVAPGAAGPAVGALPDLVPLPDMFAAIAAFDWSREAWRWVSYLFPSALLLGVVCSLDGLLAAVVTDSVTRGRHDSNRELMSQGLANVVVAGFGGLPAVGTTANPAANFLAGGRTRRSTLFHAVFVLAAMFALGPVVTAVPVAALGGLMVYIALSLIDRWSRDLVSRIRTHEGRHREVVINLGVVVIVAVSLLLANVMVAVAIGVTAAVLLLLVKLSGSPVRRHLDATVRISHRVRDDEALEVLRLHGHRIQVLELEGELFFGTADRLQSEIEALPAHTQFAILDLRRLRGIDASGARMLEVIGRRAQRGGVRLLLSHLRRDEPQGRYLEALGLGAAIETQHWFTDLDRALEWAEDRVLEEAGYREAAEELAPEQMALFAGLVPREADLLRRCLERHEFGPGDPVFHEGDDGDGMHLIARGAVSIKMRIPGETRARRLATFNAGGQFGEMALLEGQGRSADAFAKGDKVVIYSLTAHRFRELVKQEPELGVKLYHNLSRGLAARLRVTTGALRALE